LDTLLASAGQAGDTIVYRTIRRVALLAYFRFEGL